MIGHQVLARLKFNDHFTGEFAGHRGGGREICFDAVDIYTIRDARIVTNWHLEDNLNAAQAARRKRSALKIRSVREIDRQHARKLLVELCVAWRARLTLKLIG